MSLSKPTQTGRKEKPSLFWPPTKQEWKKWGMISEGDSEEDKHIY